MSRKPIAEIDFPPEWIGDEAWQMVEIVKQLVHSDSETLVFIAGGVLTDGTNLIGVCWEGGGHHVARSGPATAWAIEERIDPAAPRWVREVWSMVVEAVIGAHHDAVAELGEPPR